MKEQEQLKQKRKKAYWLYLHPYVHLSVKRNATVLYNTLNGTLLEYSDPVVLGILNRMNQKRNLYVVGVTETEATVLYAGLIREIRETFSGDIIETSRCAGKPIQFKPILKKDITTADMTIKPGHRLLEADELLDYLEELTLFINTECGMNCPMCSDAYRLFLYCTACNGKGNRLSVSDISRVVDQAVGSRLSVLNITGGNILTHPEILEITRRFNETDHTKNYFVNYLNLHECSDWLNVLKESKTNMLHLGIHFPVVMDTFTKTLETLAKVNIPTVFRMVVQSEKDLDECDGLIGRHNLDPVVFHPYYNGENNDFFKENVFITRRSLTASRLSMRHIFTNTSLNAVNFKKITVLSNGAVYANINHARLGTIGRNSITDILRQEIERGTSWFRVRRNVSPCKSCPYNALCPPITNYEYIIGRYDLCHIRPAPPLLHAENDQSVTS